MGYSLLGCAGMRVSQICLVTATFGVAPDPQEAVGTPEARSTCTEAPPASAASCPS